MRALDPRLSEIAASQPFPLLFATVSGADLYGFPSENSDWDLRGVHILPPRELLGLRRGPQTWEDCAKTEGFELDLVTHDVGKFFQLLLKKNGYVLEQLHSPLVVTSCDEHQELKELARGCVTRYHVHHYQGFGRTQRRKLSHQDPPRVKTLLYAYRVLLTGIHLMQTGEIESSLQRLDQDRRLPGVEELIARKREGGEGCVCLPGELEDHAPTLDRLEVELQDAHLASRLPEVPEVQDALHDLLLRIRLRVGSGSL